MAEIHRVKINNKGKKIYLPTTSYMDFFKNNYTIIYPNGGSKEHPANVTVGKEYIIPNPFPGYIVHCIPEVCYLEEWFDPGHMEVVSSSWYGYGMRATQHNDGNIYVITGKDYLVLSSQYKYCQLYSIDKTIPNSHLITLPCRVKVWKVGVIE